MAATITAENAHKPNRFPNLETVVGRMMLPTPQSYSKGDSKSIPGLTPLDIAVRPELAKHAERAKERRMGMLPTPKSHAGSNRRTKLTPAQMRGEAGMDLSAAVLMLPTPDEVVTNQTGAAGPMRLNPLFVQWMMGYPPGWLDVECRPSRRSATP
jgi:hypothetical protein